MKLTYRKHHREDAEAHLFIDPACPSGACTIELTGAASMTQEELDHLGAMFAAAPELLFALELAQQSLEDALQGGEYWRENAAKADLPIMRAAIATAKGDA